MTPGGEPYDSSGGFAFVAQTGIEPVFTVATSAATRIRDPPTPLLLKTPGKNTDRRRPRQAQVRRFSSPPRKRREILAFDVSRRFRGGLECDM
ncbi:MAG: hypothetical protein NTU94_15985 [Planctomycetota bacterium]|nr:hypothetical protein [Planctomycetota bacterium]